MSGVLLTGFEPFGGDAFNPSWELAQRLQGLVLQPGQEVQAVQLPCVFGRGPGGALRVLDAALRRHQPSLVLCLGLAAGRAEMSLERVAINVDDARIADNAGAQPVDKPIVRAGAAAYFSTLPIKAMAQAIQAQGVPAGISQTAGTFVCNHVFYGLMHRLAARRGVRGGFMHVPAAPEMNLPQLPTLTLDDMARGLQSALGVALVRRQDLRRSGGAVA